MADDLGYTPGAGATVATDEIGGRHFQLVKMVHGADGVAHLTANGNPMPVDVTGGELLDAIEALRFAVAALTKSIGYALPNLQGFPIMEVRQGTAANLNVTASGTVTANIGTGTLAAMTNQAQMGGFAANDQIPALMHLQADNLRRNITVT